MKQQLILKYKDIIQDALNNFIEKDIHLLELKAHEQAISHRIAVYIEQYIPNLNIDCEYNKNGNDPKTIELLITDFPKSFNCCVNSEACKSVQQAIENKDNLTPHQKRRFRPDIIVHSRDNNDNNEIVIEIKKDKICVFDLEKLQAMTKQNGAYQYKLGAFIYFPDNKPKILWFENGNKTH